MPEAKNRADNFTGLPEDNPLLWEVSDTGSPDEYIPLDKQLAWWIELLQDNYGSSEAKNARLGVVDSLMGRAKRNNNRAYEAGRVMGQELVDGLAFLAMVDGDRE